MEVVNEAARQFRAAGCDSIIAVGGGSVLDTAKGVSMLVSMGDDLMSLWAVSPWTRAAVPLCIPTPRDRQ